MTMQLADSPTAAVGGGASPPASPPIAAPQPPEMVIRPPRGWQLINVRELWQFRELLWSLAVRDVKVRYKQTALGAAWAVLQPAMLMVVFTIFFNKIGNLGANPSGDATQNTLQYALFACAGLIAWTFFSNAIT